MKNHGKIRYFRNYLQKVISRKNRTILGHPKLLHLVLSPNAIAKAFNVMCPADIDISDFGLIWANETDITEAKIKIFGWDQV